MALDQEESKLKDWEHVESSYTWKCLDSFFGKFEMKANWFNKLKNKMGFVMYAYIYDICTTFIEAHEESLHMLHEITEDQIDSLAIEMISRESIDQVEKCKNYLQNTIGDWLSEIVHSIETTRAAFTISKFQISQLKEQRKLGLIDEKDFLKLLDILIKKVQKLEFQTPVQHVPQLSSVICSIRFFDDIPMESLEKLTSFSKNLFYKPNTPLFTKSSEFDGIYIVLRGKVIEKKVEEDKDSKHAKLHTTGCMIGFPDLMRNNITHTSDAICQTSWYVSFLDFNAIEFVKRTIRELFGDEELSTRLWKASAESIICLHKHLFFDFLCKVGIKNLKPVIRATKYIQISTNQFDTVVRLTQGAIVCQGTVVAKDVTYEAYSFVNPCEEALIHRNSSILKIKFDKERERYIDKYLDVGGQLVNRLLQKKPQENRIDPRRSYWRSMSKGKESQPGLPVLKGGFSENDALNLPPNASQPLKYLSVSPTGELAQNSMEAVAEEPVESEDNQD